MPEQSDKPQLSDDAIEFMNNLGEWRSQGQSGNGWYWLFILGVFMFGLIYWQIGRIDAAIASSSLLFLVGFSMLYSKWRNDRDRD